MATFRQDLPRSATEQGRHLRRLSNRAVKAALLVWRSNRSDDFNQSFADSSLAMLSALDSGQSAIADYMAATTPDVMADMGSRSLGSASYGPDLSQLTGYAGNGEDTFDNLWSSVLRGKQWVAKGYDAATALTMIESDMEKRMRSILSDTARTSSLLTARSLASTARYIRALTPPSCGRCVVLAGTDSGRTAFERHPRCDCIAVWSTDESVLATHYTSAGDYLNSLDDDDLADALGSKANARAYRDGADVSQLVNAYRRSGDVRAAQLYGTRVKYTTEGTTKHAAAYRRMKKAGYVKEHVRMGYKYWRTDRPRLMPETIYQLSGDDHAEALRLLRNYGWIL